MTQMEEDPGNMSSSYNISIFFLYGLDLFIIFQRHLR
jgi:hypothetical protein